MVDRLSPVADELIITTNEGERLAFLDEVYPDLGIKLVPDLHNFRGALPGIHTALEAATNPFVAIVACDMLFASPRLVVAEALALKESGADAVVPVNKHGYEPFHSIYRRSGCLPAVKELRGDAEGIAEIPDLDFIHKGMAAVDMIYNPPETLFLKKARENGAKTLNGLDMLIYQGIIAYELFTDTKLPEDMASCIRKEVFGR